MPRTKQDGYVDAGRLESEQYEPDAETKEEFAEAAHSGGNRGELIEQMLEQASVSSRSRGVNPETAWKEESGSEEVVGGANPTPDQDVVEEIGKAMGLTYEDNEPLGLDEKLHERDRHRWELDPASSEDYQERTKQG
jgi:hypothetical protein